MITPMKKTAAITRRKPMTTSTIDDAKAAKKAAWHKERNARRQERYKNDPEYRDKAIASRRNSYKPRDGASHCLSNLGLVDSSGTLTAVRLSTGSPIVIGRVFTQADMAKMLGRQPQVLYRWRQREIFPSPSLVDERDNTYYSDDEAKLFIKIMGEHQQSTPHYRVGHDDIRDRLITASFHHDKNAGLRWIQAHL